MKECIVISTERHDVKYVLVSFYKQLRFVSKRNYIFQVGWKIGGPSSLSLSFPFCLSL